MRQVRNGAHGTAIFESYMGRIEAVMVTLLHVKSRLDSSLNLFSTFHCFNPIVFVARAIVPR
jgi:hypothetical protein